MYWSWVLFIKLNKKQKAEHFANEIFKHYPLTYYSMKVRAHYNDGKLTNFISKTSDVSTKLLLSKAEKESFERLQYLLEVGWFREAERGNKSFA